MFVQGVTVCRLFVFLQVCLCHDLRVEQVRGVFVAGLRRIMVTVEQVFRHLGAVGGEEANFRSNQFGQRAVGGTEHRCAAIQAFRDGEPERFIPFHGKYQSFGVFQETEFLFAAHHAVEARFGSESEAYAHFQVEAVAAEDMDMLSRQGFDDVDGSLDILDAPCRLA